MKSFFSQVKVVASQKRELFAINCLRFTSVTDNITVDFGDGSPIEVGQGDTFKTDLGYFDKVVIQADASGAATIVAGVGSLTGGASPIVGSGAGVVGTGSPEGVVTADPGVPYYDTSGATFWIKATGTATDTGWVQLL